MPDIDTLRSERDQLRNELQQLKNCQLQYFTLSVTGTAALFALASMRENFNLLPVLFLAPLVIIIPCWWIFFDKATTITRIVGYYRLLEEMIRDHPKVTYPYLGFENALAYYRKREDGGAWQAFWKQLTILHPPHSKRERGPNGSPGTRHRYWTINFWMYTALSFLCCASLKVSRALPRQ